MPKIVFFDIDNTLTDGKTHALVPSAITALNKLQEAGIMVVAATNRILCEMTLFDGLFVFDATITANGARIFIGDELLSTRSFTKAEVEHIIAFCKSTPGTNMVYCADDDYIYVDQPANIRLYPWFYEEYIPYKVREMKADDYIFQALIDSPRRADDDFLEKMKASSVKYQFYSYMSIYPQKTNKGVGCKILLDHLEVEPTECACVGDSLNDMEMFELIEESYCVGNGREELKKIAKEVIGNAEDDAVYRLCVAKGWIKE